jgi:hypothetical protein
MSLIHFSPAPLVSLRVTDTVDNTKKGIDDTVNHVKNEIEKNDIYQALAGTSPAKTAILNVVECISTDGAPIKKDADPVKTVERLAKNVEDLMKKMNKDMKRDLGAVIKHEFGDGFAKQKKDIDQLFVKLNDPKGLGLSDETAECKPDDKAVCGNTKCGKMLSSSTGFACCSDSFDYGGKPHCSHDAKLWNKLFTADRKVDPEVAKMLAKMAVSEGERQIADLQKSDSLEAEFKCMLKHILVPALPSLEAYLAQMLTKAIQEMTDLSDQFFGGDKLEKFVHKTLSSLFGGAVKLASAGKELKKIRDTVTGVANGFCEKTMATAATVGKNLKNARDSPSVRGPVCALKKTITEGKVGDVLRLAGPPMVDEALDWLHMKFLAPIEQDLANKLMSVWGTVLDFVVGLAGLIPEVGGIISDAIVVPLTYLSNTLVNPLVNMLQGEVWKKAKDAIMKVATKMLDSIVPHIEKLAEDGANALAGGTKAAKGAIGKVDQFVTENQGIITNLFVPVFQQICAAVFPKVPAIVTKCYKATNDVLELAGAADGFCEGKAGTNGTMGDKIGKIVDDVKTEVKKNVKKVEDSDIGKAVIGAGEAVNDANKKTNEKLAELKAGAKATVKAAKEKVATLKAEVKNNVGEMKVAAKAKLAEAKSKVTAAKADMKAKLSGLFK